MIIQEKEITIEKPFEPFTIELVFQTKEDITCWFKNCALNNDVSTERKRVARNEAPVAPVNRITQLLIKKGF